MLDYFQGQCVLPAYVVMIMFLIMHMRVSRSRGKRVSKMIVSLAALLQNLKVRPTPDVSENPNIPYWVDPASWPAGQIILQVSGYGFGGAIWVTGGVIW